MHLFTVILLSILSHYLGCLCNAKFANTDIYSPFIFTLSWMSRVKPKELTFYLEIFTFCGLLIFLLLSASVCKFLFQDVFSDFLGAFSWQGRNMKSCLTLSFQMTIRKEKQDFSFFSIDDAKPFQNILCSSLIVLLTFFKLILIIKHIVTCW